MRIAIIVMPHCDYDGKCKNKAYAEVYPSLMGGRYENKGWSYLCRNHYTQEQKRFKGKLPYVIVRSKRRK